MLSRSAITSNGVFLAQPLIAQQASNEERKPRAHPEPVGQNGCNTQLLAQVSSLHKPKVKIFIENNLKIHIKLPEK